MKKINIAIVGVGSCASALVQGVEFYSNTSESVGLMYADIGGYTPSDINFVAGFDIDSRKVNKKISEAIYKSPNCNMTVIPKGSKFTQISEDAIVYRGPTLDGIAEHMLDIDKSISFDESAEKEIDARKYQEILKSNNVDVILNYVPVGAENAAKFYIENAVLAGVSVVNCMPSYISTDNMKSLEGLAIKNNVTIIGNDMKSAYGASRLSEVLQGSMMDSGLMVTQHIQMNMAAGTTQGEESIANGRTANTDFLNMADESRLYNKKISKENVLTGQITTRNGSAKGMTMFAGPSLTVMQRPGGDYKATDNKICNIDMVAYGFAGARYELTCRLSVQDSPNSGGIVVDAIRFCKVAREMNIVGYLRGPSAWTQKTPPVDMITSDAKFECDAMARREYTKITLKQKRENIDITNLEYSNHNSTTEYEN
jgi:myo-inositol-1-phosphate synthase